MTNNSIKSPEKKSIVYLWFVSIVAACGGLLFGYDAVVVSGTISQVETQFTFSSAELGFYVSCVLWACMVGSGLAGWVADKLGRKKTLMTAAFVLLISAIWSGVAQSVPELISARLIGGLGIGAATMVCPLYISEISPEQYRGRMVTLFQLTITIGIIMCVFANWGIFTYAENNQTSDIATWKKYLLVTENWRAMYLAEAIPGLIFMATAFFIPESPRWLMQQERKTEAVKILKYFNPAKRAEEIGEEIESTVKEESNVKFSDLFTKKLRTPLIIAVLICFLSEACGVSVVFYYGPQIFEEAGFALGDSLGGFATIAIVNFIATIFALRFVDSAGRKKLLTVGIIGTFFAHIFIWYLFSTSQTGWPIVIAINLFVAFFAMALGPVKYVFVSEIFPNKVRGKAIAISTFTIWAASATINFLFPVMRESMSTGIIFLIFAGELLLLFPVVRYWMPETKGRTIEEIEKSWLQ
ncbi:sugar porter family MFS transporter [Labilibacter marinus]|uniref:sugar porter family MFS transporter n=1 Tax=Labilibacter marinus TaxID=1477105 RepID=UPI00094FC6CB|nr:sugar porter family MFS transporter [Labilibacter marinus]